MAKNASGNAFINSKKKAEERKLAREAGLEVDGEDDLFELQHHHLLNCLEKTTVSPCLQVVPDKRLYVMSFYDNTPARLCLSYISASHPSWYLVYYYF